MSGETPIRMKWSAAGWMDLQRTLSLGTPETIILYERDGSEVSIETGEQPLRFLFITGKPLNEPVAWYGPIVMNTKEELRTAFEEYQNGTFVKHQ